MKDLPLEEVYVYLLERTARQFQRYAQAVMAENGIYISGEQWVVIKRISENEGISQREIAHLTYKDPASVTRMLDLMENEKLVKREKSTKDRRVYALYLTSKGKSLVEKMTPIAQQARAHGLSGINEADAAKLKVMLNKIYQNFS